MERKMFKDERNANMFVEGSTSTADVLVWFSLLVKFSSSVKFAIVPGAYSSNKHVSLSSNSFLLCTCRNIIYCKFDLAAVSSWYSQL